MIEERYIKLINKRLDGDITGQEQAELDRYLANSVEAQDLDRDFSAIDSMLHELNRVDPPGQLKTEILKIIDHAKYQKEPVVWGGSSWSRARLFPGSGRVTRCY